MESAQFNKRIGLAIILGNSFAWADFALYAYFSPILTKVFFPNTDYSTAFFLYFAVFALGFVFRPIGSLITGSLADTYGRKNTLLVTIIISAITTTLIGCLPSYNSIGVFSPILLAILGILQTMSISAEPTNSGALLIEYAPPNRRGLVASCVMIGVFLGFFFGIFSFLVISYAFTPEQNAVWGWRLPFISSLVIGALVANFLRKTEESPLFLKNKEEGKLSKSPIKDSFSQQFKSIFIGFGYAIMMAVGNYFLLGYVPNFLHHTVGLDLKEANLYITISVAITVILIPIMGHISDKIGRKPVMAAGALGFVILSYPILQMMQTGEAILVALSLAVYGILLAPVAALVPTAISEMFPSAIRCTDSTIGYNAALVLCGGTTPIIAAALVKFSGNELAPFWYIAGIAGIHLAFVLSSKESSRLNMN